MRKATHPEYQQDYESGYDAMQFTISTLGFDAARDLFNKTYPLGEQFETLEKYYYAFGGIDALLDHK